ncbi:hypothetical protein ACU40U_17670, partial [Staphylococcus arlettae]
MVDQFLPQKIILCVTGQCLKKLVTGFNQILVGVIKMYLFGSYSRFKSLYKFLGIILYELT